MMKRAIAVFAWVLLVAAGHNAYAAQRQTPNSTTSDSKNQEVTALASKEWILERILDAGGTEERDLPVSAMTGGPLVRLQFYDRGHLSVRVCNFLSFQYVLFGHRGIRASQVFQTMAACSADEDMRIEEQVKRQLVQLRRYSISPSSSDGCRLILAFADGTRWYLSCRHAPP